MSYTLQHRNCPVCDSSKRERLLPSVKYDLRERRFRQADAIWLCVCQECGVTYEDPGIVYLASAEYADQGYYVEGNEAEEHNKLQITLANYRWQLLHDRLQLKQGAVTLDVGATGAWSAKVVSQVTASVNHLVEPSSAAIALCKRLYPEVIPHHAVFDSPSFGIADGVDLITFFYSLYCMDNPACSLAKARDLLRENGRLLINISHVLMQNEIWDLNGKRPWLEMEHIARGTPVVYYDPISISILLGLSGFQIDEKFIFQHPENSYFQGRQETFILATKAKKRTREAVLAENRGAENSTRSRSRLLSYCMQASVKSMNQFSQHYPLKRLGLLCEDDDYLALLIPLAKTLGIECIHFAPVQLPSADLATIDYVFNLLKRPLTNEETSLLARGKRVDALQPVMLDTYDLTTTTASGDKIMTRSCLPFREYGADLFPWERDTTEVRKL